MVILGWKSNRAPGWLLLAMSTAVPAQVVSNPRADDRGKQVLVMPAHCGVVERTALAFLRERGIEVALDDPEQALLEDLRRGGYAVQQKTTCVGCFYLRSATVSPRKKRYEPLRDAQRIPLPRTSKAMQLYTDWPNKSEKSGFGRWLSFDAFHLQRGVLNLSPINDHCELSLVHRYGVYGIDWILFWPADGGETTIGTNGRLEHEYLVGIRQALGTK